MYLYKENQIDKHIIAVEKEAGKLQDKIHSLGVSILKVWHDAEAKSRGEASVVACSRLNALAKASPYHSNAFTKWVSMFTPLVWNAEENLWVEHSKNTTIKGKVFIEARDTPFWKVSPPPAPKPFDIFDYLERGITKQDKHIKEPVDGDVVDVKVNNLIREILKLRA